MLATAYLTPQLLCACRHYRCVGFQASWILRASNKWTLSVADPTDPTFQVLRPATAEVLPVEVDSEVVTFSFYLLVGSFPPFSNFFIVFMEVLGKYQLCMAHNSMNAILALAILMHPCKAFVGVRVPPPVPCDSTWWG